MLFLSFIMKYHEYLLFGSQTKTLSHIIKLSTYYHGVNEFPQN